MKYTRLTVIAALAMSLGGCGWLPKQNEYEKVDAGRSLEIPPDLDEPNTSNSVRIPNATYSAVSGGAVGVQSDEKKLEAVEGAELLDYEGDQVLALSDGLGSAWRRVGFALDRVGIEVDGASEETKIYRVEYVDTDAREQRPGIFSRWFLRKKGPIDHSGIYQVRLKSYNDKITLIEIRGEQGGLAADPVKDEVLSLLRDRLS